MTTTNPKRMKCACQSRTTTCLQSDSDYLLKKTCFLLKDDFGCKMIKRQVNLLENYIRVSSGGILLKDVKYLLLVLEFLAKHSEEVQEYQPLLVSLLKLFHLPPLQHESDITHYEKYLEELFTVLGFLIVLLHDIKLQWYAISAISCLLNASSHDKKTKRVNFSTCLKAAENSQLSTIVGQLLEVIDSRLYPSLTYLALQLCANSIKCSWKIGATGALDFLLLRLNKKYPVFNTSSDIDVCMLQDSNLFSLLWTLLRAAQMKPSDAPGWPNISMQALWCLRTWLRYVTCNNLRYIRNSVVALIILLIEVFPEVLVVLSGLAHDLVTLAVVRELGAEDDWVHGLEMSKDQLDFDFKKLVILGVCYLARYPSAIHIMKSRHVAKSLVLLVEPGYLNSSSQWGRSHLWSLLISALQALSVLTPFLLEDLVQSSASTRLLLLLEWHTQQPYDYSVLVPCLTAMVHLTAQRQEHLIENIYDQGGFSTVLRICLKLMTKSFLSLEDQHVMSICLTILEQICRDHGSIQELHGSPVINLVTSFIKKETTNPSMVPVDDRLVICLLDLLWECVVWCPKNCELFVKIGGVFLLLDLLKCSIFPVQILLLAVLTDLTEQGDCVPHFVTWRDAQGKGYLPLLVDIWREEEQRIGVPRGRYGMIKDTAIPLMGKAQYDYTYIFKKDMSSSPAVVDIYASARPKIYGIIQMLGHRHKDVVEELQAHYQMYHNTLCSEDKVIFQVVKNYLALKMAEVWAEVSQDMEAQGLVPLESDDTVVKVLSQRLHIWGEYIQALQRIILEELKVCTEDNIRRRLILDSEMTKDLHTKQELEVVAASMDPEFRAMKSKFESSQVSVTFPDDIPDDQCHITFEAHPNHKMLLNQHVGILDGGIEALDVSPFEKWDWRYFNFAAEGKQSLMKTEDFSKCQYN